MGQAHCAHLLSQYGDCWLFSFMLCTPHLALVAGFLALLPADFFRILILMSLSLSLSPRYSLATLCAPKCFTTAPTVGTSTQQASGAPSNPVLFFCLLKSRGGEMDTETQRWIWRWTPSPQQKSKQMPALPPPDNEPASLAD